MSGDGSAQRYPKCRDDGGGGGEKKEKKKKKKKKRGRASFERRYGKSPIV